MTVALLLVAFFAIGVAHLALRRAHRAESDLEHISAELDDAHLNLAAWIASGGESVWRKRAIAVLRLANQAQDDRDQLHTELRAMTSDREAMGQQAVELGLQLEGALRREAQLQEQREADAVEAVQTYEAARVVAADSCAAVAAHAARELERLQPVVVAAESYVDAGGATGDSDVACDLQAAVHSLRSRRVCSVLDACFDGEADAGAFREHLPGCERCQRVLHGRMLEHGAATGTRGLE